MKKVFFILIIILIKVDFSNAQFPDWVNYTSKGNTVYDITWDGNNLWLACSSGILCDINFFNSTNSILPVNDIRCASYGWGNKWFGTHGGGLIKLHDSIWTVYNSTNSGIHHNFIYSTAIAPNGKLWLIEGDSSGINKQLTSFDGSVWTTYNTLNSPLSAKNIHAFSIDGSGNIWVGSGDSLVKYDSINWTVYDRANSGLHFQNINVIGNSPDGKVWLGMNDSLVMYNDTIFTVYDNNITGMHFNKITSVECQQVNTVWIGSQSNGLFKFDGTVWTNYNSTNSGIHSDSINALCFIGSQGLSIGTQDMGIVDFASNSTWWNSNVPGNNLSDNYVKEIIIDSLGTKWILTSNSLVKVINNNWIPAYSSPYYQDYPLYGFHSFALDNSANPWICHWNSDLINFDGMGWAHIPFQGWGFCRNTVIDPLGNKWITTSFGLLKYDGISWTSFNSSNSGLPSDDVFDVAFDNSGNMWVGTAGGLTKYDGSNWTTTNPVSVGALSQTVRAIAFDANNNLWIGTGCNTYSGSGLGCDIMKFDGTNWIGYNTLNTNLPQSSVTTINFDANGNLWAGTDNGLVEFDGTNWMVANTFNSGLLSDSIRSIAFDSNGDKWIATCGGGVAVYKGGNLPNGCSAHFVIIEDTAMAHHYYVINTATGAAPINYLWDWGDGNTSTGAFPSHTYDTAGYYSICLTVSDNSGCSSYYCWSSPLIKSGNSMITVDVVSPFSVNTIEKAENFDISVYPNPAKENVSIEVSEGLKSSELKIFNIQGKLVKYFILNSTQTTINISDLESGFYFIKVQDEHKTLLRKLVVE